MRDAIRVKLIGIVAISSLGLVEPRLAAQQPELQVAGAMPEMGALTRSASIPDAFAGTWDYNPLESINILTGRPEQAPRSATAGAGRGGILRPGTAGPATAGAASGGRGAGAGGFGGGTGDLNASRPSSSGPSLGPTPEMMREQRDMSRDLLEVPEQYRIALTSGQITFVDDIERERTFQVDGRKQKYRLGASEFTARVEWTGTQLRKEIEGSLGYRMTEVYLLSPDAKRMFVIVRVGQANRNRPPSGFNRVYDRLDLTQSAEAIASR